MDFPKYIDTISKGQSILCFKDLYPCLIDIIKGLIDMEQFQYFYKI